VDGQTLVGSAAAYFLIGLAFSWLYLAIDVWNNDQLNLDPANTADYPEFSFIVMTTVGFGNQIPTANLAARIVVVEVLIAQLFLATFVARIVSLYGRRRFDSGIATSEDDDTANAGPAADATAGVGGDVTQDVSANVTADDADTRTDVPTENPAT
jgi:Ion channel